MKQTSMLLYMKSNSVSGIIMEESIKKSQISYRGRKRLRYVLYEVASTDQQREKAGEQSSDDVLSSPLPSPFADNTREQQKISDSWDALKDVLERVSDSANYSEQILNNRYSNLPKTWKQSIKKNIVTLWKMRSDFYKTMA